LKGKHRVISEFFAELIHLRRSLPALIHLSRGNQEVVSWERERILMVRRWRGTGQVLQVFNFGDAEATLTFQMPVGSWTKILDTKAERWEGGGPSLPDRVESKGEVTLTFPPEALVVFSHSTGDEV
jgi:maltooligosyltrehalose trehalohydrolase